MDTFNTCFDEEDLLCPASQRITSKAWMYETPYPILPPVDALPCANETALPAEPSDYLTCQSLDPEEAVHYAAIYQAAKELVEEDPEEPCTIHAELEEDPEEPESKYSDYHTYQVAKQLVEDEFARGAQLQRDLLLYVNSIEWATEVDYERDWMPKIHAHKSRLRAYMTALNCMAPPGVLDPLK